MSIPTLIIAIITYGFALWLGLYLIARDYSKAYLRYTGLGLIAYSLALLTDMLISSSSAEVPPIYLALHTYLVFMPSILWSAALNDLLPSGKRFPVRILPLWLFVILPASVLFFNLSKNQITGVFIILFILVFLPLLIVLIKFIKVFPHARAKQTYGLLIVASLFFGLSTGLAFIPIDWLPRFWVLLAIGLDLEILAYGIAFLDAFEEGESLKGDILRSFQAAFFSALLFGGQVALVIYLGAGLNIAMIALLLGTITAAISLVTLAAPLQTQLDRLVFFRSAQMQTDRADLRAAARSLGRANLDIDPTGLDDRDFTRYTRRALSHFGDLPRLASNPLTRLPLVDERLQAKSTRLDTLNRAAELKLMLTESIQRLKPNTPDDFGTSDEWRFYNALYFPYVIGLKPYRRVSSHSSLDPLSEQVLEWFQLEVPERTLHNWQNAAAGLIAQDLREQLKDE